MARRLQELSYADLPELGPDDWGYVYVIEVEGWIKIGWSKPVIDRLGALQTGFPGELQIHGILPGVPRLEKQFHRRFRAYRKRGEWFERKGALARWIDEGCPIQRSTRSKHSTVDFELNMPLGEQFALDLIRRLIVPRPPEMLVSAKALEKEMGIDGQLSDWCKRGVFVAPVMIGRRLYFRWSAVCDWMVSLARDGASDHPHSEPMPITSANSSSPAAVPMITPCPDSSPKSAPTATMIAPNFATSGRSRLLHRARAIDNLKSRNAKAERVESGVESQPRKGDLSG